MYSYSRCGIKNYNLMSIETQKISLIERLVRTTDESILRKIEKFFEKVDKRKKKRTLPSQLSPSRNYRKRSPKERISYLDDLL